LLAEKGGNEHHADHENKVLAGVTAVEKTGTAGGSNKQ